MLRFLCFVTTFFVLSSACLTVLSVAFQDVQDLCQSSDVLWLWSGALTSRSIRFKFGLREGYTCADSDFVLYAFPELLEGEKPHSAIATCNGVDGGKRGTEKRGVRRLTRHRTSRSVTSWNSHIVIENIAMN